MLDVQKGEIEKLGILFDRHHRSLYSFLVRLTGDTAASEDLVQEVFLRMLKYNHTYKGRSRFTVWMFQIARNARIDYYHKGKRETSEEKHANEYPSNDPSPSARLAFEEEMELVRTALSKLPIEYREVLLLSRFHDMKYADIAETLGCAVGTVKARVHHAIKELRETFFELSGEKS
jgi:RNA polymerase sigma-70 factor (ECF subfamily)